MGPILFGNKKYIVDITLSTGEAVLDLKRIRIGKDSYKEEAVQHTDDEVRKIIEDFKKSNYKGTIEVYEVIETYDITTSDDLSVKDMVLTLVVNTEKVMEVKF